MTLETTAKKAAQQALEAAQAMKKNIVPRVTTKAQAIREALEKAMKS